MRPLPLILLALLAAACDGFNAIEKEVEYPVGMSVHGRDRLCTQEVEFLDLTTKKDFTENKDKVDKIEVIGISVKIVNPNTSGDSKATVASGAAWILPPGVEADAHASTDDTAEEPVDPGAGAVKIMSFGNVPIQAKHEEPVEYDKAAVEQLINALLKPPHKVQAIGRGCADAKPNFFTYDVRFKVRLTLAVVGGGDAFDGEE